MATEKKTFLFNAKNGIFTANLTDSLKQTPNIMDNLDLANPKMMDIVIPQNRKNGLTLHQQKKFNGLNFDEINNRDKLLNETLQFISKN